MVRLLAFVLSLAGLLLTLLWIIQRRMIYFPIADIPTPAQVGLPRGVEVSFKTSDDLTLNGWFVPARTADSKTIVIVFNGNAGNRAFRADLAARLSDASLAVLLFDYRGYGENPGSPSEGGLALDAQAARRYAESRADVDKRRIVYFGESLGAAVAIRLAVEHRPRALILRSPFTSLVDIGRFHYRFLPVSWLLRDRFPSLDWIRRLDCPLLVVAGSDDTIIPRAQSERLFAAARGPKTLVTIDSADHNDEELVAGAKVVAAVTQFLESLP